MNIQEFFDPQTSTLSYVVWDPRTLDALVIDPVWDYEPAASITDTRSFTALVQYIKNNLLKVHYILETHAHADHLSSSQLLKKVFPQAVLAINERICEVQRVFKEALDLNHLKTDGSQFDRLLKDGEMLRAGSLSLKVLFTPGHTPACTSFLCDGVVFTGDALFMPDSGVGRCDFPQGSAEQLFQSITQRLYTLPDSTQVYTGHDYQPGGRVLQFQSTIGAQKESNIHLSSKTSREAFIKFRTERDRTLSAPKLLLSSIQINIDGGHLPPQHENGKRYLSIPISERA